MKRLGILAMLISLCSNSAWGAGYAVENKDRIQQQRAEIRQRIETGIQQGYRFFTLEQYLASGSNLPLGTKIAVAGHYRERNSISNQTGTGRIYVITDHATPNSKAKLLQCLKAVVAVNAPCPTMALGTISTCSVTTYGYPDGKVTCIDVRDIWMLSDIDQIWSMDEVWTLSPLTQEIINMQNRTAERQVR